jgi:hypothetical protein
MVTTGIEQIEKDLNLICNHVPINDKTTLDVLCNDPNGQLVILQISVDEDDIMLLQGMQSLDYVDKFKSFLKATYNKHKIDDKERPRLILVAPSFSDALRRVVESMRGIRIDLYEWEYLKLGDHKGLRLQPVFAYSPTDKSRDEAKPTEKREPRSTRKKEPASASEKKEERMPEEPPVKEEYQPPPPAPEEEPFPKQESDEHPKRKLKLF